MDFTNINNTNITDIKNNEIFNFLVASFLAHGFFDLITFIPHIIDNLSLYISFTILFTTLMVNIPSVTIILFIGMSMYHFGEDFRYILQKKENTRWGGVMLFSSSVLFGYDIWIDTLKWLNVYKPALLTFAVLAMGIPSLLQSINYPLSILIPLIIGLGGPIPNLLLYACCVHSPLAIYRYVSSFNTKCEKISCIIIWISGTCVVYLFMPLMHNITPFFFKFSVGYVISHIIYVTKWQLKNTIVKKNQNIGNFI